MNRPVEELVEKRRQMKQQKELERQAKDSMKEEL